MKDFLNILLGFFLLATISAINFFVFAFIIRFSLPSIVTMLFVHIILSIILFVFIKKKYLRIGILACSIVFLFYVGNNLYKKLNYVEHEAATINTTDFEKSEQDKREDLMKDTSLTLLEKFSNMKFGKLSDSIVIAFSVKNEKKKRKSDLSINSLKTDFSKFNIKRKPDDEYFQKSDSLIYSNDSLLRIVLENGKEIVKRLLPSNKNDSIVYLGFLPSQNLFIIAEGMTEYGIDYISIDAENGQVMDGIPLFRSTDEKYYSFINLHHFLGSLELVVKYWIRLEDGHYQKIHEEKIPFELSLENYDKTPYEISSIEWNKSTFSFILTYHNYLKKEIDCILVESKIINLKTE